MIHKSKSLLKQKLDALTKLHPRSIDLTLDRLIQLLHKLGDPHLHLPPVIHIAGTNGKGSTQAFLTSLLQAHNKSVHSYISPHLVDFNERINLAGQHIPNETLIALIDEVTAINDGQPITFFEITTAIAFLAFSRHAADFLILEVGLGGKFDATNVIASTLATVITPISLDHQDFLGNDILKIAAEKAGIMKTSAPSFWAKQPDDILSVLRHHAHLCNCPYEIENSNWYDFDFPTLGLYGIHQHQNAALALAVARYILGSAFSEHKARHGLKNASWTGRMQHIQEGKLFDMIANQHELWVDGAHNPHGAQSLAQNLKHMQKCDSKPWYLILAMLNNRDINAWFAPLYDIFDMAISMPITASSNGHDPEFLAQALQKHNMNATAMTDFNKAFALLANEPNGRIILTGSLYFLGEFLSYNSTVK